MKFSLPLITSALVAFLPAITLACVQASGYISIDAIGELSVTGELWDNGGHVCSSTQYGWYVDQDNHYSIRCVPGYVYAFTKDAKTVWYGYPRHSFSWNQNPLATSDYCNPPQGQWCFLTEWNVKEYC